MLHSWCEPAFFQYGALTPVRQREIEVKTIKSEFLLVQLALLTGGMILEHRDVRGAKQKRDASCHTRWADERLNTLPDEIRSRINRGESFAAIARDLNSRGVRGRYGGRWYPASVQAFAKRHPPFP